MTLQKFEVREMIAKGGMAEVYRAQTVGPEGFAKEVCVKKILPHLTEDQTFVKMFVNEAKLAATLNFANIVQVHDLCVSANQEYFIVMEYVEGKDLSDVIRAAQLAGRGECPADISVYVAREVAKGLYYAHTKRDSSGAPLNIIHRDISPQNILVSYMGEVKITDFGIAKASSSMSKTAVGILKGKYGYMSPEQARGERIDARSDIFCLGIVLYELLVGERCFAGASDYSTLNLMREAVVTPPTRINEKVPKELEAIVLKALAKSPDDRYADALELEGALAKWASDAKQDARATDLARFMRELFDPTKEPVGAPSGTLDLASVVGPAPEAPPAELGKEAIARMEKRGEAKKSEAPPARKSEAPPPPKKSEAPPPAKKSEAPPPAKKSEAPPPAKKSEAPSADKAESAEDKEAARAARIAAAKEKAAAAKAKKAADGENEAPAEKPAKAEKPEKAEKEDKADAKKRAAENKVPLGRKTLKPGATAIHDVRQQSRKLGLGKGAVIAGIAAVAGAAYAGINRQAVAQEGMLRAVETENAPKSVHAVLVKTSLPGAKVLLDGKEVPGSTPLELLIPDASPHELEVVAEGKSVSKQTIKPDPTGHQTLDIKLSSEGSKLTIDTIPSGQPVLVDGKPVGNSPVEVAVLPGSRVIEMGPKREKRVAVEVSEPKFELKEYVPLENPSATLAIELDPKLEVRVEGRPTGQRADGSPIALDAGKARKITLVTPEGKVVQRFSTKLAPGEHRVLMMDGSEEPKKPKSNP